MISLICKIINNFLRGFMDLLNKLFENQDKEYASFQAKLMPGIKVENVIGVRLPLARKIAKEFIKDDESKTFLKELPHKYYDENIVHGMLISEIKDYDTCIEEIERFLPYRVVQLFSIIQFCTFSA